MAFIVHISTLEENVSSIPIRKGQLIFTTDTGSIYWDFAVDERQRLTDIIILDTEEDRPENPISRFYYVISSKTLYYRVSSSWVILGRDVEARLLALEDSVSWHSI